MATVPLISDDDATPEVRAVFDAIRAARGSDYVNDFWRALANDPPMLRATWARMAEVMGEGGLDPVVKEMLYIAVSVAHGCNYCVHSHMAAARAKGMTGQQHGELLAIVAMASQTNALATMLGIEPDKTFRHQDPAPG